MSQRIILSSLLLGLLALPVGAGDAKLRHICKNDPETVGPCFKIRGRVFATNGTPSVRIWRVGTKRILGVHEKVLNAGNADQTLIPENLAEAFQPFENQVYGDLEVCPYTTEKPAEMQFVCIESASRLRVEWLTEPPKSFPSKN